MHVNTIYKYKYKLISNLYIYIYIIFKVIIINDL